MPEATSAEISVSAPPSAILDVIADLASYPKWSEGVRSVTVLQADPKGRPVRATMVIEVGPVSDTCEFAYDWSAPDRVAWTLVSARLISDLAGTYACRDNGDGTTTVSYDLSLEFAVPLVGAVRRRGEKHLTRTALRGLKRFVEAGRPTVEDQP